MEGAGDEPVQWSLYAFWVPDYHNGFATCESTDNYTYVSVVVLLPFENFVIALPCFASLLAINILLAMTGDTKL